MSVSSLVNRNVVIGSLRTGMRLERELWDALLEIGEREGQDVNTLIGQIEAAGYIGGRTSAVRVFIVDYYRSAATASGPLVARNQASLLHQVPQQAKSEFVAV